MNWKEELRKASLIGLIDTVYKMENFIETEIIEKLIEEIPETQYIHELEMYTISERNKNLKHQLRARWLGTTRYYV